MKKTLKRTLIITGSIAGALVLTVIILSVIIVRPLSPFTGVDYRLDVVNNPITAQNAAHENDIKSKLSSVRFSVMRSLLEFNTNYKIKPVTTDVDGQEERETLESASFLSLTAVEGQYMLRFTFKSTQTHAKLTDECGNLIKFDSLILIINNSNDRIQPVVMYPYLRGNLNNNYIDAEGFPLDTADSEGKINSIYYKVYKFSAKMYTSEVYDFLVEKDFKAGASNAA